MGHLLRTSSNVITSAGRITQSSLSKKMHGRVAALFVLVFVAAVLALSSGTWAKTNTSTKETGIGTLALQNPHTEGRQASLSKSINRPFNFVSLDGTASTFLTTSAGSLSQFNDFFLGSAPAITAAAPLSRQQGPAAVNAQIATVSDPDQAVDTLAVSATPLTGTGVTINNISIDLAGNVTADVAASCTATDSTFTLTVTDNASATATDTLTVNVTASDTPTITPDGPTTFCEGGSVTLTSSSTSGNQWYSGGNPIIGATNQTYSATASGDYTVTVDSCAPSLATTVTVNPIPATPTVTPDGPTTFCEGGSVTLTSSSTSGNQWYLNGNSIVGATNQTYSATASGDYTVTITASGCTSAPSTATTVTVNPIPATPTVTPDGPTTFCEGGSVTLTSSSTSGNQWYLNGNSIVGATNQTYSATASGDYTNTVTASGCTSAPSTATTVTVNPIPTTPTVTPDGPTTFCEGGSVTLTSSSTSGNQWYLNGNSIVGATNQMYSATASGDYTVTITASGCTSAPSTATTVTVNPIPTTPTVTPDGPTTFCEGGSVTLTSSSASGNQWYLGGNPINGATNQTYSATASGDYTVTITTSGCTSAPSAATTVTVNPIPTTPTVTPGGPTTFCEGGSVTLTSSSASGNQWYLNGNSIVGATNQTYSATASGDYTVTITASGCTSAPSTATTVTVNPIPATPTVTPDGPTTFCEGGSVTLTSSSASGNQWYLGGNPINGATNQTYSGTASGDYTVTITTSGCTSAPSTATTVTVNPIPATPTITPSEETTLCAGGNVTLTSSSATGNQWYLDGNPISGATNQQFTATVGGNYTVTVTTSGCTSVPSAATTVTPNVAPVLTYASPQSVAFDGSLSVSTTSASASITGYAVQSVVPALTTAPTVNASGAVSITNAQPTGSHTITIRATDGCGVTVDASFTLNVTLATTYSDPSGICGGNAPCYTSIQAAINALTGPGTVNVGGGTYNEDVNLSTNVTLNINGDTTINSLTMSAGTLNGSNGGNFTLTLAPGGWSNDGGTFNPGTGTVSFTGTGQTIGGTNATTFNNLMIGAGGTTVNGPSPGDGQNLGVSGSASIAADKTVRGVLTLTGDLTVTSPAKLIMPASASSTGSGDVIGNVERLGFVTAACAGAPCSNTLSVGNPNNQITITSGTAPTSIVVNLTKAAPASYLAAVQRNYNITESGGSAFTATLRLHYLDSELNGNTPESDLNLRRFNGSTWPAVVRSAPVDSTDNWVESNAVTGFSEWTFASLAPTATSSSIRGQILSNDGGQIAGAVVRLSGTQNRKTITDANGDYGFEDVETGGFYSLTPSLLSYHFNPEVRSFSQIGNSTSAVFTATRDAGIAGNAIDTAEYFVRQHYLDFLGREPDESGFNFWSDQILSCGSDATCIERRTINVSAAYFLSIEFQQTGGLVDGLYRASYGRAPRYAEFMPDTQNVAPGLIVGTRDWAQRLTASKQAFVAAWVARPEFRAAYDGLTSDAYVEALISHTGVSFSQSERDALVSGLSSETLTRADVLKRIVEDDRFVQAKRNEAFVMMEYFGYLRRDPDTSGYQFWLDKLNQFGGNFERAEMVKAFIDSGEYRDRFPR